MPEPKSVEKQLREWLGQLAPEHKQMLHRMLAEDEKLLQAARIEMAETQLNHLCSERGQDWQKMTDKERETFLDDLIRENELYSTQVGPASFFANVVCYHCGRDVTPEDLYRIYFGDRQQPKIEATNARLIVLDIEAGNAQFSVETQGETLIGRLDPHRGIRPTVDLSKFDPASRVSRRHARITARGTQYFIEDLGSANGTIINGRVRLKPQTPHVLAAGDLVKIGETTLKFVA